jgi:hypothetical protein
MFNLKLPPIGKVKQPRQETDDALFDRVNKVNYIFNDIEKKEMEKIKQQIRMYFYIITRSHESYIDHFIWLNQHPTKTQGRQ